MGVKRNFLVKRVDLRVVRPAVAGAVAGVSIGGRVSRALRVLAVVLAMVASASSQANVRLEVTVEPLQPAVRDNIQALLGRVEAQDRSRLRQQFRHIRAQIQSATRALGYYQATSELEISDGEELRLKVAVALGEPVRLATVQVEALGPGADSEAFARLDDRAQQLGLIAGAVLHHGRYEELKTYIEQRARRYGYFEGRFAGVDEQPRLLVDVARQRAEIHLRYQTGPRYRLGAAEFSASAFDPLLLQRLVPFEPGTPYEAGLVGELNRQLLSSGYFHSVQVTASPEQAEAGVIPVRIDVQERKPHSLSLGGGFSTDVGVRGRLDWRQHWLNPQGHSRGLETELSQVRQQLGGYYQIPLSQPLTHNLRFFTGLKKEHVDDIDSESLSLGTELRKRLDSGWQRTLGLRLQQEDFTVGSDSGHSTLMIPSLVFHRQQHGGDEVDPASGYSLLMDVQFAKRGLISDTDFARLMTQAKGLITVQEDHRLLGRLQLGGIATNDFSELPPSLRFFAGGDQSIRGYDYQSLSPVDRDGDNLGGRYLMVGSLEYQYELLPRWRLATFVDHGNAVNSLTEPLKTSVGVGVQWVSPIGSLRLYLARSMSDPEEGFRLHFSMGPEL